jgi:hypothetical protein
MKVRFESDFTGARAKIEAMKRFPRASLYLITKWGTDTIKAIKTARILKSKSGMLMRNVGIQSQGGDTPRVILGTGVGSAKEVPYARIQDEGGVIHAKNKLLTIPIPPAKGRVANYPGRFYIKSKAGNVLCCQRSGKGLKILFVLKEQVTIPASHWFSRPLTDRLPYLDSMLEPEKLWQTAQKLEA